jgi:hypothetical protein
MSELLFQTLNSRSSARRELRMMPSAAGPTVMRRSYGVICLQAMRVAADSSGTIASSVMAP